MCMLHVCESKWRKIFHRLVYLFLVLCCERKEQLQSRVTAEYLNDNRKLHKVRARRALLNVKPVMYVAHQLSMVGMTLSSVKVSARGGSTVCVRGSLLLITVHSQVVQHLFCVGCVHTSSTMILLVSCIQR